jgi:hypothetical protein
VTLPQWDPVPPPPRRRLHAAARRVVRIAGLSGGTAAVLLILLAASPRAPEGFKQHLPWRESLDAPAILPQNEVRRWPRGEILYHNAVAEQAWAVGAAVRVWNESGADVRFTEVPAERADLVIERIEVQGCRRAEATVGRVPRPRVRVFGIDPATPGCDPYNAAQALAHELGHVLGLEHDEGGCAAMNARGNLRGPEHCVRTPPGTWRCRLLELADVRRAVELYGGEVRPLRGPRACDL